jgi:hypothetical protein
MHQFPVRELEDNRSLGDLLSELNSELRLLVQQELALAKTELKQKLSLLGKDIAYIAGGATLAFVAFQVFVAMLIIVLALIMPLWLSALLVGVILAGVAYGLIRKGLDGLEKHDIKPDFTAKSLEEDKEWIKNQVT